MTIQRALQLITSLLKHHLHAPERLLLLTGCNVPNALIDSVSGGAVCRHSSRETIKKPHALGA
jgi:hypothetical protein